PRDAVDLVEGSQPFLSRNVPYYLRFAVRDTEFPHPPIPERAFQRATLRSPGGLRPGDTLEVSYASESLSPAEGHVPLEVPRAGQSAVANFRVVPTPASAAEVLVRLQVRLRDLPFYSAVLRPTIALGDVAPPPHPTSRTWMTDAHLVDSATFANYTPTRTGDVRIL